jgi:hypothetical protein
MKLNKDTRIRILEITRFINHCYTELEYLEEVLKTMIESKGISINSEENLKLFKSFNQYMQNTTFTNQPLYVILYSVTDIDKKYYKYQLKIFQKYFDIFQKDFKQCEIQVKEHIKSEIYNSGARDYRHLVGNALAEVDIAIDSIIDRIENIEKYEGSQMNKNSKSKSNKQILKASGVQNG